MKIFIVQYNKISLKNEIVKNLENSLFYLKIKKK